MRVRLSPLLFRLHPNALATARLEGDMLFLQIDEGPLLSLDLGRVDSFSVSVFSTL